MPLIKIDSFDGRTDAQNQAMLDAIHRAVLAAFKVPEGDRYQILTQHPASEMVIEDTGLGIKRSRNAVVLQITTRPRPRDQKEAFYRLVVDELETACGIAPSDVVISLVENTDADWSFAFGRAQFLTGEL